MSVKILANGLGKIYYREGDIDAVYGIASLSKIWALVLLYARMQEIATQRHVSIEIILGEKITATIDYGAMVYNRMDMRPDLSPPDDPLTYQPFRPEKFRFRLPVEKGQSYATRTLIEASLFQSKNDAIQLLADHFFARDDNKMFRVASAALAQKLGLQKTKIGDPHGLNDGDNVTTALELVKFCAFVISNGYLQFFGSFNPAGKHHTAQPLLDNVMLAQKNIQIILAKTATGSNRHGNDLAQSLLAIAKTEAGYKIGIILSDEAIFDSAASLLAR